MSYEMVFDNHHMERIATNAGFHDLIDWGKSIPVKSFPHLTHIIYYGEVTGLSALKAEFSKAMSQYPVQEQSVTSTIKNIIRLISANEHSANWAAFTNGMVPDTTNKASGFGSSVSPVKKNSKKRD